MNAANIELCRELYQLSGWEGDPPTGLHVDHRVDGPGSIVPAYHLDYLLGKIKAFASAEEMAYISTATSPEDAACNVAIHLFNRGVLQKGSDG